ncbi:MAG TPA: hypothetical protein VEB22_09900, partial [Phycisphaerales bacterium]|nr:hypothetical protein [Phycisphaerales bacterium]
MTEDVPTKAIASCFGLAAFVIAIAAGVLVGNPAEDIILKAVPAMFICTAVGYGIGAFTTRAISDNIQAAAQAAAAAATQAAEEQARITALENELPSRPASATVSAPHKPSAAKAGPATTPISTPARASN